MDNQENEIKKFTDIISKTKIATLVTHSTLDGLKGRPMSTSDIGSDGDLWFFTNEYTEKVEEISNNNQVLLSYNNPSENSYVVINGTASLVKDKSKMELLWNPALKAWFPEGLEDPQIMLLKVEPDDVEYWNGSSSKIVFAFKVLKAIVKGEKYNESEHGKLNLQ